MTKTLTIAEAMNRIEALEERLAVLEHGITISVNHYHHNTQLGGGAGYPQTGPWPVTCGGRGAA